MSGRKRKSRGGAAEELTREQQVQRDWTLEAHKKIKRGGDDLDGDDDDEMDVDGPHLKRSAGRPRKSLTPKKKPPSEEVKEQREERQEEDEDVLADLLYEPRPLPQSSRSRSRRRESGLHLPMPSAGAPPSPAPLAPSFRSPSPRGLPPAAPKSSQRSVTQQVRFDAPTPKAAVTPKAAPKSSAKLSAAKLSASTPQAAPSAAIYTPRSASLRKSPSGAASLLLLLGLMALVLARLVFFPVHQAPPSAASLGAARGAYLFVPTLSDLGTWVSLRVGPSLSSLSGKAPSERSAHFASAWRRLETVESGLASQQREREELSNRTQGLSAAAGRVNATFASLDAEPARIIREKDSWSAAHGQQQGQDSPETAAATRLAEAAGAHQQELDSRAAALAGRLDSMRDRVEARDGVGKLEAAAGHVEAMRALAGAAEGGAESEQEATEGEEEDWDWEEQLQESVRVVVNEALHLQRAIRQ